MTDTTIASVPLNEVNRVLALVKIMSTDGDDQLATLTAALVTYCRATGVPKDAMLYLAGEVYDRHVKQGKH